MTKETMVIMPVIKRYPYTFDHTLENAVESWQDFCAMDLEKKERLTLRQFETNLSDPGYRRRNPVNGSDEKEFFHFTSMTEGLLNMEGLIVEKMSMREKRFMYYGHALLNMMRGLFTRSSSLKFTENWDLNSKIHGEINRSTNLITLRFLRYSEKMSGDVIATPHIDKSGLTAHLYSSHPGLQYAVMDDRGKLVNWEWLNVAKDEIAIFASHQMNSLSGGTVKPLVHRVIQPNMSESRYSVVLFVPFISEPRFPKEKRVQEMMAELGYHL